MVSSMAFAGAPRAHGGMAPEIGSNERAVIARKDETILTPDQMNAMGRTEVNIANITDPSMLDAYMASVRGKNAFLNIISMNRRTIRRVLA